MSQALTTADSAAAAQIERVMIEGDLSTLSPDERVKYYRATCDSLGLNYLTKPFEYIRLNGKLVLYAKKDATEQLRKLQGISIERQETEIIEGVYVVTAYGRDKTGRTDCAKGAVSIHSLKGEALANAIMKAETKAKRRLTLSLAGLGWLDETEVESIPHSERIPEDQQISAADVVATIEQEAKNGAESQTTGGADDETIYIDECDSIGRGLYGDEWEENRVKAAQHASGGGSSRIEDLLPNELAKLVQVLRQRKAQKAAA